MIERLGWRLYVFVGCIFALLAVLGIEEYYNDISCMGVRILSEQAYGKYMPAEKEADIDILLDGTQAAVDKGTNTIYISQQIVNGDTYKDLQGSLKTADSRISLLFAPDDSFYNLSAAVAEGHKFKLLVASEKQYVEYNVVFTTLPVMKLDGDVIGNDDDGWELYSGIVSLWNPYDPDVESRSLKMSQGEWHVRGGTSAYEEKKSWRLSLKSEDGSNKNLSFLGLGKDDDWILNAMVFDDLKIRDKFNGELWNRMQENSENQYLMSQGEYVELIIDGEYSGLYLLQRRVDAKYLGLDEGDILMKGNSTWTPQTVEEAYRIVYASMDETTAYAIAEPFFAGCATKDISLQNWIDLEIFLQFGCMGDNSGYKNMFYVWQQKSDGYAIYYVPWDTDMSYGLLWEDGYVYAPAAVVMNKEEYARQYKYDEMNAEYPDLHEKLSKRWKELRETLIQTEILVDMIEQYESITKDSGALSREYAKWGYRYSGEDTVEALLNFIEERIAVLDEYYSL